jgi:hypothetical protein
MEEHAIIPPKQRAVDSGIPDHLFQVPFRLVIYGVSSSGKGVLLNNLLGHGDRFPYKNLFKKNVFIFSETFRLGDPSFVDLGHLPEDRIINGYREDVIRQIWDEQDKIIKQHGKSKAPHICILFDDTLTSLSQAKQSLLNRLFFQGRHSKISTIITSQHYSSVPKSVRLNADSSIFFSMNTKQALIAGDEQVIDPHEFVAFLRAATEESFSFLTVMYKHPVSTRYQLRLTGKYFEAAS